MAGSLTQSVVSTQYVQVQVSAIQGGSPYDPTSNPVSMAFVPSASPLSPQSGDWNDANWETDGSVYWASILIGPANGGLVLPSGSFTVWVKVDGDPEIPALPGPYLTITP